MGNQLPTVGGDSGVWGTELNNWLLGDHNADGTHHVPTIVPSGDSTGATDAANFTAVVNAGIKAFTAAPGTFYVNTFPVLPAGTIFFGAKGSTPSAYDGNPPSDGTIIQPTAGFNAATGQTAVIPVGGGGCHLRDFWIDCTSFWSNLSAGQLTTSSTPNNSLNGIDDGTGYNACQYRNVGVYAATNRGFQINGGGCHVLECLANIAYADGFWGGWTDCILINCHAQGCGQNALSAGFFIASGECTFIGCRGDLSQSGFSIAAPIGKSVVDMVRLTSCSTQRNNHNGFYIHGSSGQTPILLDGCMSDGDGINGTLQPAGGTPGANIVSGAGSGNYAQIRIQGNNTVLISGFCGSVNTRDVARGCPAYGLITAAESTTVPNLVSIDNVFFNAMSGATWDSAPSTKFQVGPNVWAYVGGIYKGNNTTLPSQVGATGITTAQPSVTTPGVPASTVAVTNTTGYDVMVYVNGTITAATNIGSTSVGDTTVKSYYLPRGQTITLTYTSTPSWVWLAV
jgi:hypothetical protein